MAISEYRIIAGFDFVIILSQKPIIMKCNKNHVVYIFSMQKLGNFMRREFSNVIASINRNSDIISPYIVNFW